MTKTPLDRIDYLIQWYKDEDSSHDYSNLDVAKELGEIRKDVYVIYAELIITELKSALAAEREKHRWIPVTEKLPKPYHGVLIYRYGAPSPVIAFWTGKKWALDVMTDDWTCDVWCEIPFPELPAPPEEEE